MEASESGRWQMRRRIHSFPAVPPAGVALALALALAVGSSGCDLLGPDREPFTVRVDSISAPEAIAPGETLTVTFHGTVGPNGCHRLERVESARGPGRLEVRFHGERRKRRGMDCTQMIVTLDHVEQVPPPLEDPFTIAVRQPGGGTLERGVRVEGGSPPVPATPSSPRAVRPQGVGSDHGELATLASPP